MQLAFRSRFDCDAIGELMCMRAHTFDLTHERLQTVGLMPAQMPNAGEGRRTVREHSDGGDARRDLPCGGQIEFAQCPNGSIGTHRQRATVAVIEFLTISELVERSAVKRDVGAEPVQDRRQQPAGLCGVRRPVRHAHRP